MAMCPLNLVRSLHRLTASPTAAFQLRASQPNVRRPVTVVNVLPDGAVDNASFRNASVQDQIALLVKEAVEVRGLVAKQDAILLVIGEEKVLNVATQVCTVVRYVELMRLYASGFLEKESKTVFYETTSSPYSSLLRRLKDVSMKPLMEDVLDGETIEEFAAKTDALYRDRNRSTHPPSAAELDRMVEAALMLVSPQMAAQSPLAAHACFILQAYRDKLKALLRPYLLAAAEEEA